MSDPIRHQASKTFGPTFAGELAAQPGLLDVIGSWGDDGVIEFTPAATVAERDAVIAVAAAHDPARTLPAPPQGSAFAGVLFRSLAGATDAEKFNRGARLLVTSPAALGFLHTLDVERPAPLRVALLRQLWAGIKADPVIGPGGGDPEALTDTECEAIEADGRDHFGIDLVG